MKNQKIKYFFDQDDDGHWYLVPAERRTEWGAWKNIPLTEEDAWEPPSFALRIDDVSDEEFYLV